MSWTKVTKVTSGVTYGWGEAPWGSSPWGGSSEENWIKRAKITDTWIKQTKAE